MILRFDTATLPATPWKNSGGTTREIASWPPEAGLDGFDWRVSIATIAASGPFSVFAGVDRTIMLLEGEGVRLEQLCAGPPQTRLPPLRGAGAVLGDRGQTSKAKGFDHRLDRPHEPFAFPGDAMLQCTLLGGVSTDFNVMIRRARCRADVRLIDGAELLEASPHGVLMSLRGGWQAGGETLAAGEGLWWADTPSAWRLAPVGSDNRLVSVRCWPVPAEA